MKERDSFNLFANDKNIVIKPIDKCDKIVVMDTDDNQRACLEILKNSEYYEELSYNPNGQHNTAQKMKKSLTENFIFCAT